LEFGRITYPKFCAFFYEKNVPMRKLIVILIPKDFIPCSDSFFLSTLPPFEGKILLQNQPQKGILESHIWKNVFGVLEIRFQLVYVSIRGFNWVPFEKQNNNASENEHPKKTLLKNQK